MNDSCPKNTMELDQLQELISDGAPATLERGVDAGLKILSGIKSAFENAKNVPEIAQWIEASDKLRSQVAYERTVVGVVGSTGVGKSSVINAVLDEECLVPTNWYVTSRPLLSPKTTSPFQESLSPRPNQE